LASELEGTPLSTDETTEPQTPLGIDPAASRRIFLGMLALLAGAALAYNMLKTPASPPPKAIAGDPLLVQGRVIYLSRCVGCHGEAGRGDGPTAKSLTGPSVGDLSDATWKHGDRPDQVRKVVAQGVQNTAMPAWGGVLEEPELRAVSAYVYYLAGRKVPEQLRTP
jgi:cytochrome c oxidase cbb3-type subunit 3